MARSICDANVVIRLLTGDDPAKADACRCLMERCSRREIELFVSDLCLAEIAWTLRSFYGLERQAIAQRLVALLNSPGLAFTNRSLLIDVTQRYRETNVDYIDAYHAALAAQRGEAVYSYDRDFDRFGDVERLEP